MLGAYPVCVLWKSNGTSVILYQLIKMHITLQITAEAQSYE